MRSIFISFCTVLVSSSAFAFVSGSCIYSTESFVTCWDYDGYPETAVPEIQRACEEPNEEGNSGQWHSGSACTSEKRVGRCDLTPESSQTEVINFYEPTSTDDAQLMCELTAGRWLP